MNGGRKEQKKYTNFGYSIYDKVHAYRYTWTTKKEVMEAGYFMEQKQMISNGAYSLA